MKSPLLVLAIFALASAQTPEASISNRAITAKFYLPDAARGYYRGTRFDWSGVMPSLRAAKHEYFGQWFPKYDPKLHDAIMGPVEEFRSADGGLGYAEAAPGGTFVRIGVGVVRKPAEPEPAFQAFRTYDIVDHGRWRVKTSRDRIQFTHDLAAPNGYAYRYTKTIRLDKSGAPRMAIEHGLQNRGRRRIETAQYNHNFFVIDGKSTGPGAFVKFPFDLRAKRPFTNSFAEVRGGEIHYREEIPLGQSVFGEFDGFGPTAADYDVRVENRQAGAGVRIRGDRPLSRVVYWSIKTVFSPEPYIDLAVDPGQTIRWTYNYEFYDLAP